MRSQVFLRDEQKARVVMAVSGTKRVIKKSKAVPCVTTEPIAPNILVPPVSAGGGEKEETPREDEACGGSSSVADEGVDNDTGEVVFQDSPEFAAVRQDYQFELNELRSRSTRVQLEACMAELERRRLTVEWIERALRFRRVKVHAHMLEVADELHLPLSENEVKRIHDNALQLFKVLHRRRVAVLRGQKLPREDSVFSKVKFCE